MTSAEPLLIVRETLERGRGVFAGRTIEAGEILEDAPVIVLPAEQRDAVMHTRLYEYVFRWGHDQLAICLGFGSLYNHSKTPNAKYVRHFEEQFIRFMAISRIERDEEICTNYKSNTRDRSELWFEDKS